LREAADDSKVTSIKITLYRLARNSKVIDALCRAAENGKEVLVMIELRARFDEENNIEWSKMLQNAGCNVIYGPKGYKAHSKLLLITRKTDSGFEYITQVGTGNYNEKTATLYTDLTLMTADAEIAEDAENVFYGLTTGTFVEKTNKLLVAPLCLQNKIIEMIDDEITAAKNGEEAYIGVKINSLTDKQIIDKLVEASCAGVKIELVVRGICCLVAGVKGYTENVTVKSIVGRFLEHSRIYIFGTSQRQKIYISSADFMTRNTVKRVEVAAPVLSDKLKKRICNMFEVLMADNVKSRIMSKNGRYSKKKDDVCEPLNAQEYFYDEAYKNARAKAERKLKNAARKKKSAPKTKKSKNKGK
jgi:polyphosphate kinase